MQLRRLGKTGITVSRLCFGSLTIGPLQAKLPLKEGARVIARAFDSGVNFIDTAQLYGTYPYIREAINGRKNQIIIASKSYAYEYEDMRRSVEDACRQVGRDYLDIFMLHEQVSRLTLKGHAEALRYLVDAKTKGQVRAIGISTHMVEVVEAAAYMPEIDVIHPILNMSGIGICDGSKEDMLAAINQARIQQKGIYSMKALAGGHLTNKSQEALRWILSQPDIESVAVGMQCTEEIEFNCRMFNGEDITEILQVQLSGREKRLLVEDWCVGCGKCAEKCPMKAIEIQDGRATVNGRCVLCGYCGAYCPEFCLKII